MLNKITAVACCFSLLLCEPGVQNVFAGNETEQAVPIGEYIANQEGEQWVLAGKHVVDLGGGRTAVYPSHWVRVNPGSGALSEADLDALQRALADGKLQISPERRRELLEVAGRMRGALESSGELADDQKEAIESIRALIKGVQDPNATTELLLADFYHGIQPLAARAEAAVNYTNVAYGNEEHRVRRTWNDRRNHLAEEVRIDKVDHRVSRAEVYKPDSRKKGDQKVLDVLAFVYEQDGVQQQKVVWSRPLAQQALRIKRQFSEMKGARAEVEYLEKTGDNPERLKSLKSQIAENEKKYKDIAATIQAIESAKPEALGAQVHSIADAERLAAQTERWMSAVQNFGGQLQLEQIQKALIQLIIMYFSSVLGINLNLQKQGKDGQLSLEDAQKLLEKFERGTYGNGYGWLGAFWANKAGRTELPPAVQAVAAKAIRYLGYAVAARGRLGGAREPGRQDTAAVNQEVGQWEQLAMLQLQIFELYLYSDILKQFRDGEDVSGMQLPEKARPEATRLMGVARNEFLRRYEQLEGLVEQTLKRQTAATFAFKLQGARDMNLSPEVLAEFLAILRAQANEMQSLYLAGRFREWVADRQNLEAYRQSRAAAGGGKGRGSAGAEFADQLNGGMYNFFLGRLDAGTQSGVAVLRGLAVQLENIRAANPEAARQDLAGVNRQFLAALKVLGLDEAPTLSQVDKEAQRVGVLQQSLGTAFQATEKQIQTFLTFHQMSLSLERMASASGSAASRSKNWFARRLDMKDIDVLINGVTRGGAEKATNWLARLWDSKAFEGVGAEGKKRLMSAILDDMSGNRYEDAYQKIAQLDPETAKRAAEWHKLDIAGLEEEENGDLDIGRLLTKAPSGDLAAQMQGVMTQLPVYVKNYVRAYQLGSLLVSSAAMMVLTPALGYALAGATRLVGSIARFGGDLIKGEKLAAELNALSRFGFKTFEFGDRFFTTISQNVVRRLELAGLSANANTPTFTAVDMAVASLKATRSNSLVVGGAGAMMQGMGYAWSPKNSPYSSMWDAVSEGFIMNAAWGVKGGWTFSMMPPATAFQGAGLLSRGYRAFGMGTPLNWTMGSLAKAVAAGDVAWPKLLGWAPRAARGIAEHEQGFWGHISAKVDMVKSPAAQFTLNAVKFPVAFVDGIGKFWLATEAANEMVQLGSQGGRYALAKAAPDRNAKKENDDFAPSERLQRLATSHRDAMMAQQVAFMFIPTPNHYSAKDMSMFKESRAGLAMLRGLDAERINDYLAKASDGSAKIQVKLPWYRLPLRHLRGNAELNRTVDVVSETHGKKFLQETLLQDRKASKTLLFALDMLPDVEADKQGVKGRQNHQRLWSEGELLRALEGDKAFEPSDKTGSREPLYYLDPELNEAAGRMLKEELLAEPDLFIKIDQATNELELDRHVIRNPEAIKAIRLRAKWLLIDQRGPEHEALVIDNLRRLEKEAGGLNAGNLTEFLDKAGKPGGAVDVVWDDIRKQEEKQGILGRNRARAMEDPGIKNVVKSDLLFRYVWDFVNRNAGKASAEDIPVIRDAAISAVNKVLKDSQGVINKKDNNRVIERLRTKEEMGVPAQKEALEEFITAVLEGDAAKEARARDGALRLFTLLEAGGGKTLLYKVAFVPLESARLGETRKLWYMTSTGALVQQFADDWANYSGGRKPTFKATTISDAKFEEVRRKQQGDRSIGAEYHFIIDEADKPFNEPSNSIGKSNGSVTEGNPVLDARFKYLEPMRAKIKELEARKKEWEKQGIPEPRRDALIGGEINAAIDGWVKEGAEDLRKAVSEVKGPSLKYAALKVLSVARIVDDPATEERKEAANFDRIVREFYGRLPKDFVKGQAADSFYKLRDIWGAKGEPLGRRLGRVWSWLGDDGMETFMRVELERQYRTLTLPDASIEYRLDQKSGRPVPVFFGSEIPSLSTEYRSTATLLMLQDRRKDPGSHQGDPVKWDLPLEHQMVIDLREFFDRLRDAGADVLMASGTAGGKVAEYLTRDFGARFVNEAGRTRKRAKELQVVDKAGNVSIVGLDGVVREEKLLDARSQIKVDRVEGMRAEEIPLIRHLVRLGREALDPENAVAGKKNLLLIAPPSKAFMEALRQALLNDPVLRSRGLDQKKMFSFFPDFARRMKEGHEMKEMMEEHNINAIYKGEALVGFLVPEVSGRGVDLPFKTGGYDGTITFLSVNSHGVPDVEDTQLFARAGPGRIGKATLRAIGVASRETLLGYKNHIGNLEYRYDGELHRKMEEALSPQPTQDEAVLGLRKLLTERPEAFKTLTGADGKLVSAGSKEFQDIAARADVYRVMVPVMQDMAQRGANESSGILKPKANGLTQGKLIGMPILLTLGGMALIHFMGAGIFSIPALVVGAVNGLVGMRAKYLLKAQKAKGNAAAGSSALESAVTSAVPAAPAAPTIPMMQAAPVAGAAPVNSAAAPAPNSAAAVVEPVPAAAHTKNPAAVISEPAQQAGTSPAVLPESPMAESPIHELLRQRRAKP